MHASAALVLFMLVVAPIICAVDFGFYRKVARHKPNGLWRALFGVPLVLLVIAAVSGARVLFPIALLLGGRCRWPGSSGGGASAEGVENRRRWD